MSVWDKYLPETRLRWSEGFDSAPIWPSEPDLSTIKNIFASELFEDGDHHNDPELEVQFLADGAHHKVYEANHPSWTTTYLLRVAVPLDPCLKMESEMATLAFLRQNTSIPVPKPISWNSDANNELGYEWSIVEKAPGVMLKDAWRKMSFEQQTVLTRKMATFLGELWNNENRFDQIGSLYISPTSTESTAPDEPSTFKVQPRHVKLDDSEKLRFTIGPIIESDFKSGRRPYLPGFRGPYSNEQEWLKALVDIQKQFIESAKILLEARDEAPSQYREDPEAWKTLVEEDIQVDVDDFLDDYDLHQKACRDYTDMIPKVFPAAQPDLNPISSNQSVGRDPSERFILYHNDLRSANIIVNPETSEITGIIDWEHTKAVPDWFGMQYPEFIVKPVPFDEYEPRIPTTYDEESDDYNFVVVDQRDWWECRILRGEFDKQLQELGYPNPWKPSSPLAEIKRNILYGSCYLTDDWERAGEYVEDAREQWEKLERKKKDLEELAWQELQGKVALRDKHCQELRELIAKQEEEYKKMLASWEEKKRELEEKYEKKEDN